MRHFAALLACLGLVASAAAQSSAPARFRFWKPIEFKAALKDEEIVAFRLDSDVYNATRPGLPDLRVFDKDQAETPYLIETEVESREERTRRPFATEVINLRPDGATLEITLRLPDKSPAAEGFTIVSPLTNYERKVRVAGSADGKQWTALVTDGIVFDYSRFMDVSRRDVPLPKNDFRQFKITVEDAIDEASSPFKELTRTFKGDKDKADQTVERTTIERRPFRIDRIAAWTSDAREQVQRTKTVIYPAASVEVKEDSAKKQTVITVKTKREPITRFLLETPSRNFSRRAVVEAPVVRGVVTDWQPIGEATISNISYRKEHHEQLAIGVPERREAEYRIVIHNEDNPVLSVKGVQAEGNVQRVVFMAQPGKTYRVYYGSESAEAPRYEAATVLAKAGQRTPPVEVVLGEQTANPDFATQTSVRGALNNWIFLGGAVVVMVAVLGWALFRAARRMDELPKE